MFIAHTNAGDGGSMAYTRSGDVKPIVSAVVLNTGEGRADHWRYPRGYRDPFRGAKISNAKRLLGRLTEVRFCYRFAAFLGSAPAFTK
jgi:hypothetical protein